MTAPGSSSDAPPYGAATARGIRRRPRALFVPVFIAMTAAVTLASCVGSREADVPPDERFGHRFEESGPEGRRTIAILPADSAVSYFYYPAVLDTVHIRPAPFTSPAAAGAEVPVEVLVKGSLPDGCTELNDVTQERYGHIIVMKVETRRPQGAVCTRVMRPFRFYVRLEGMYGPGSFTLKINDRYYPFSVDPPEAG